MDLDVKMKAVMLGAVFIIVSSFLSIAFTYFYQYFTTLECCD